MATNKKSLWNTGLFISPSGTPELDCATTKIDTAERSISIGRESLKVFFVLGTLAYLQIPPLGSSRDEKWRAQWIRKRSVSWNLPELSQLWRCNGGFGPCTAQNHLPGGTCKYAKAPSTKKNFEIFSTYWYAPFCRVCLGCCAVEFGSFGGTYE